jgi:hypothetical protein
MLQPLDEAVHVKRTNRREEHKPNGRRPNDDPEG